jgi:lipid-binding SYLF domain-containing protein
MLSYSRSRGAFAGVSLEGSTLRPDGGANEKLYGKGVTAAEIVEEGKREAPEEAHELISRLHQASPHLQK